MCIFKNPIFFSDIAKEREVEGDLVELDAGMGVPFRPGTFDGCIRYVSFPLHPI